MSYYYDDEDPGPAETSERNPDRNTTPVAFSPATPYNADANTPPPKQLKKNDNDYSLVPATPSGYDEVGPAVATPVGYDDPDGPGEPASQSSYGNDSANSTHDSSSDWSSSESDDDNDESGPAGTYDDDNQGAPAPDGEVRDTPRSRQRAVPLSQSLESVSHGTYRFHADGSRDWNAEFQAILEMPHAEPHTWLLLRELTTSFVSTASYFGKVIISEIALPSQHKTIRPVSLGGVAGGDKWMVNGIIFKFSRDVELRPGFWMYGGTKRDDSRAMKAANQELLGLKTYFGAHVPGLCVPLLANVDYCGFRLVCVARIPIGSGSLVYGSCDGGNSVRADDPYMNELMDTAASRLNFAKHPVGDKRLSAPGDIEGHIGSDRRYYLLDFARFSPPESPHGNVLLSNEPRSIFYCYLRPELVRSWKDPLSADAFSRWGRSLNGGPAQELEATMHNERVTECTVHLFRYEIPRFAQDFDRECSRADGKPENSLVPAGLSAHSTSQLRSRRMIELLHRSGINIRHLGLVFDALPAASSASSTVLVEMIARVVKQELQVAMRNTVLERGVVAELSTKELMARYLNVLIGRDATSRRFWTKQVYTLLSEKFKGLNLPRIHSESSMGKWLSFHPRFKGHMELLVERLSYVAGFQVNARIKETLKRHHDKRVPIVFATDIELAPRVKYSGILELAEGLVLGHQASQVPLEESYVLLQDASAHLQRAVGSMPTDFALLTSWSSMLARQCAIVGRFLPLNPQLDEPLKLAHEKCVVALSVNPNYVPALSSLARICASRCDIVGATNALVRLLSIASGQKGRDENAAAVVSMHPFKFDESAEAASSAWADLVSEVRRLRQNPGGSYHQVRRLPLLEACALACGAVKYDDVDFETDVEFKPPHLGQHRLSFQPGDIVATKTLSSAPHDVGLGTQVTLLRSLFFELYALLANKDNIVQGIAFPWVESREEKDARLRGLVELLLSLDESALDDYLYDMTNFEAHCLADIRVCDGKLGYLLYLCGPGELNEDGSRQPPLAPRLLARVERVLIPNLHGEHFDVDDIMPDAVSGRSKCQAKDLSDRVLGYFFIRMLVKCKSLCLQFRQTDDAAFWAAIAKELPHFAAFTPVHLQKLTFSTRSFSPDGIRTMAKLLGSVKEVQVDTSSAGCNDDDMERLIRACGPELHLLYLKDVTESLPMASPSLWKAIAAASGPDGKLRLSLGSNESQKAPWTKAMLECQQLRLDGLSWRRGDLFSSFPVCLAENLAHLDIRNFPLDSVALENLASFSGLRSLVLGPISSSCSRVDLWKEFFGNTKSLRELELLNWGNEAQYQIFQTALTEASEFLARASALAFARQTGMMDATIVACLRQVRSLRTLTIGGRFQDGCAAAGLCASFKHIGDTCSDLVELDLNSVCSPLCEGCCRSIMKLPLRTLSANYNSAKSAAFGRALADGKAAETLVKLSAAELFNSWPLSAFTRFLTRAPHVEEIDVTNTFAFSRKAFKVASQSCPRLTSLILSLERASDEDLAALSLIRSLRVLELNVTSSWITLNNGWYRFFQTTQKGPARTSYLQILAAANLTLNQSLFAHKD